ncbi:MAG: VOC family protein [Thermoplasmata archaeon]|jgi:catechol 2,3-dioxygenase-like lactoylglutathione lyase family enzyme
MFLDYAGIRVTNLAKAVRFYTKGLGLIERQRGKMDHGGIWVLLEDRISHQQLELNWYPKGSKYATPYVLGEGLDHLGVRVRDIGTAARRLRAAGARKVEEFRGSEVVLAYYEGPDGVWIELIPTEGE